jgi:uncharacterized protein
VNRVGVELNTASPSLLSYVAGLGPSLAANIVQHRDDQGGFRARNQLLDVTRLGPKAFEQAAGFLRIRNADHPLDRTAVHPERYDLVERIAADLDMPLSALVENEAAVKSIDLDRYTSDDVGRPTLQDIADELLKPGRDPRDTFEAPSFREDVKEVKDLKKGMKLDGVVTNVVAFGAFVDIGVHQDGLVHVSQLADRFVKDPADVVRVGDNVKVTVISVDLDRNRIGLSLKPDPFGDSPQRTDRGPQAQENPSTRGRKGSRAQGRNKGRRGAPDDRHPRQPRPGDIAPNGIRFT